MAFSSLSSLSNLKDQFSYLLHTLYLRLIEIVESFRSSSISTSLVPTILTPLIGFVTLLTFRFLLRKIRDAWVLRGIKPLPGPKGWPIVGNAFELARGAKAGEMLWDTFARLGKEYKSEFRVWRRYYDGIDAFMIQAM
jgi:hypothetical protein